MNPLTWRTPEYIHTYKTSDWYWIVGAVTVTLTVVAIVLGNTILGLLILVSGFVLSLSASREPEIISVSVSQKGITVDKLFYSYETLECFWVETEQGYPHIVLQSKKRFAPYISILIEGVDPDTVQKTLILYLKETRISEPLLKKILLYLGF